MLQYEVAKKLYNEMKEKAAKQSEEFREFYQEFLKDAAEYAKTRLSWSFLDLTEKRADDASRSIKHDGYMAMLNAVCRNLRIEEIDKILPDRKTKGDFACYVALFLELEQR